MVGELSVLTIRSCLWKGKKGHETGQWGDRKGWWEDGLSDRRRWQQTSGAEKLWSGPEDDSPWHFTSVCFFSYFSPPLACILFYILTLIYCINLLFFGWLSLSQPHISLWVMFRTVAWQNETVCSSKMPRNKVFQFLLEINIFWACYCICVCKIYCVLVHTLLRHIQCLYYWMCIFVCF